MRAARRKELEKFFHNLEHWNRVVVKDAHGASGDGTAETAPEPIPTTERHTFIRVGCDLDSAEPKPDAKLA